MKTSEGLRWAPVKLEARLTEPEDVLTSVCANLLGFVELSVLNFRLRWIPAEGVPRAFELLALRGRLRSGRPSHTRPFSRHVRQFSSPEQRIFFLRQVKHAARTRPDRFSLWLGSDMKRNTIPLSFVGDGGGSDIVCVVERALLPRYFGLRCSSEMGRMSLEVLIGRSAEDQVRFGSDMSSKVLVGRASNMRVFVRNEREPYAAGIIVLTSEQQ